MVFKMLKNKYSHRDSGCVIACVKLGSVIICKKLLNFENHILSEIVFVIFLEQI